MDDLDPFKQKLDGTARHPGTVALLKHFRFAHLPQNLQVISKTCSELAFQMADALPEGPDLTHGLRNLLAAKDDFVRALIP